jgi:hypothetical protein
VVVRQGKRLLAGSQAMADVIRAFRQVGRLALCSDNQPSKMSRFLLAGGTHK